MDFRQTLSRLAKADFADSLGVALSSDAISIAHVRKRFNTVSVLAHTTRSLDAPTERRWAMILDVVREFVEQQGMESARVTVALDRRHTLLGQIQIPAAATDNADSVVRYELDRIIPVASSALYAEHYSRPLGSAGERVAVCVVAGLREQVEHAYREFAAAGFPLSAVTGTAVALNDYYAFSRGEQRRTGGICYVDGDRECLTVSCDGLMVSCVHFDPRVESRAERLRRELERVAPEKIGESVEIVAEHPVGDEESLGSIAPPGLFVHGKPPEGWLEIAAVGAALGQLGEARRRINLLPPEMAKAEQGIGIRELALSAGVVALALTLGGSIAFKNLSVSNALAAEVARLSPKVTQVSRQEEENRKLLTRIELVERDRSRSVLAYLQAMTEAIPKAAYLTTFRYKGDRIEADGIAESASGLIGVLEKSPFFKNVEFTAPTTKYLQAQERFSLRMELER